MNGISDSDDADRRAVETAFKTEFADSGIKFDPGRQ